MENFISFFNSNFFVGLITFLVGGFAIYLYKKKNSDTKRDAAKIILQEIRRAEDIVNDYKEHEQYQFTKKIVATNSWAKNINHFVGDLDQDELDKISNLYSTGEYLDKIIEKISDYTFEKNIQGFEQGITELQQKLQTQLQSLQSASVTGGTPQSDSQIKAMPLPLNIRAPWKGLLDQITLKYEPIYHSTIANKLKTIAKIR